VISSNGRWVVLILEDEKVLAWNVDAGTPVGPAFAVDGAPVDVQFFDDGSLLVESAEGVRSWNPATGEARFPLVRTKDRIETVTIGPAEDWFAVIDVAGRIILHAATDGSEIERTPPVGGTDREFDVSADGRHLLLRDGGTTLTVWGPGPGPDGPAGLPERINLRHEAPVGRADFLPDGRSLLTVSGERVVRVWAGVVGDLAGRSLPEPVAGSKANRVAVADTPAGVRELWRTAVGEVELRTADGVRVGEPLGRTIQPVMFTKDGRGVVGQIGGSRLRAWSAETAAPLGPPVFEPAGIPWSHISADRARWATSSKGRVRVWDVATGRVVSEVVRPPSPAYASFAAVHFAVDSAHLFVFWNDGLCLLWDPAAAKAVWTRHLAPYVGGIWPTHDGRAVLVHEASDRVRILSTQTGDDLAPVVQQVGSFFLADISSTGHLILGTSATNTARAWDVRTGRRVGPPLPAVFSAATPAISPDDRYVATSPAPQLVRVYELATGYPITPPVPTPDRVNEIKFRRDGSAVTVRFGARESSLLVPTDPRPAADLVRLCELLAAHHVDDTGTLAPLTPDELAERWTDLKRKGMPELADAPADRHAWHLAHAAQAAEDESWFAAAFHFRTLTELDPANPEWARRLRYAEDAEAAPELAPVPRKGR